MIYLLHGEETILSREKLRGIIKTYVDKYQYLNFFDFDFSKDGGVKKNSLEDLKQASINNSLFVVKKLLVIRNLFEEKVILEKFLNFIETANIVSDNDFIIVFFEDKNIKESDLAIIKKIAKIQEFKKINNQEIRLFIQKEVELLGAVISQEVVEKLLGANQNIHWIKNELKKLVAFDKNINLKNFELLTISEKNSTIFELTDSLAVGNKKQAFRVFEELLKRGESEMGIFAMIIFLVRSLLIVKDSRDSDSSYGGLNPYVFSKLKRVIGRFSLAKDPSVNNLQDSPSSSRNFSPFPQSKTAHRTYSTARIFFNQKDEILQKSEGESTGNYLRNGPNLKTMYQELFEIELAVKSGRGQIKPLLTAFFFRF